MPIRLPTFDSFSSSMRNSFPQREHVPFVEEPTEPIIRLSRIRIIWSFTMSRVKRIVLALYFLLLAYSLVWIPWSITSSDKHGIRHQRLGYGWLWAGPRQPKPQRGQFSLCDLDPAPANCSDVESELEQGQRWDAISRQATPDLYPIALRFMAISLIAASALLLIGLQISAASPQRLKPEA